jgi:CRP/FNR family transcriptional regulator, cyclic AMP receptor protein
MHGAVSGFFDYPTNPLDERSGEQSFLADRPPEDWALILDHAETRRLAPGEVLIEQGADDRSMYLLTRGTLAGHLYGRPLKTVEAPSVVGEMAFLDGQPRSLTLVAETACEVHRLTRDGFETLSARHPELGRELLAELGRLVAGRLRRATTMLGDVAL